MIIPAMTNAELLAALALLHEVASEAADDEIRTARRAVAKEIARRAEKWIEVNVDAGKDWGVLHPEAK